MDRLKFVLPRTAASVPEEAARELLALLRPEALALMAVTLGIWAGSHFFGVGEIADIVLLIVGYAALGGVALEAAQHITAAIKNIVQGRTEADLYAAAADLTTAISLVTVQTVLLILLRRRPDNTFKQPFKTSPPPYRRAFPQSLPRNGGFRYKPSITFTRTLDADFGTTSPLGDIHVGRKFFPGTPNPRDTMRETLFHEQVHQFLTPKLYLLREVRIYAAQSALRRSFILRYLEEALAETIAQLRVHGFEPGTLKKGFQAPFQKRYQLSFRAMGEEGKGLLLGPVIAGGMVFNVYYGMQEEEP